MNAGRLVGRGAPPTSEASDWHNPLFDQEHYLARYPDVSSAGISAEQDYRVRGVSAGRDPNALFDTVWYLGQNPDVAASGMNPLDHYYRFGAAERRDPCNLFSTAWYLQQYPDVDASGVNPLLHYLRHGRAEGRLPCPAQSRVDAILARVAAELAERPRTTASALGPRRFNRITLFHGERSEYLALSALAPVARERGYDVVFSDVLDAPADVGVYCYASPVSDNSQFSVVMLHDMGQEWWPERQSDDENHWRISPWNEFDLGILPGRAWSQAWRKFSDQPSARPRLGVFELGWPKADLAFAKPSSFAQDVARLRRSLGLNERPSVLYALSWESAEKQAAFISALRELPVNLLIKPRPQSGPTRRRVAQNVFQIEPNMSIMECLALSDVIVSDESSCLAEALLFEVPGVAVTDWQVPALPGMWPRREIATPGEPPVVRQPLSARPPAPPSFPINTLLAGLRPAVEAALRHSVERRWQIRQEREHWFSHVGRSSEMIMDVLDAALTNSPWPVQPLGPQERS